MDRISSAQSAQSKPSACARNHHLWRNGRLWWIAFVVRRADGSRGRVRRSLKTADVRVARIRRDAVLAAWERMFGERPLLRIPAGVAGLEAR